ncbi:hypothetical protein PoB_002389100 [Plakobranchus ocellatus]|uniref:Uncharacterized protein n=1 Tax=Plakobranchus ocellatus TaxID=259542 RepID=A0AAV3ZDS7_9GAST|nr:hypothetical protein PoB_002389100 [Plakobranchus ocellatus]
MRPILPKSRVDLQIEAGVDECYFNRLRLESCWDSRCADCNKPLQTPNDPNRPQQTAAGRYRPLRTAIKKTDTDRSDRYGRLQTVAERNRALQTATERYNATDFRRSHQTTTER